MDQEIVGVMVLTRSFSASDFRAYNPVAFPGRPANKKVTVERGNYPKYPTSIVCSVLPVIVKN